jgi:HTH-type transcriptional regulator/antitoxin HipB
MHISNNADLAALAARARQAQGLTQADVAMLAGVGRKFVMDLEKGKPTIQFGKALQVLAILGIGFDAVADWLDAEGDNA